MSIYSRFLAISNGADTQVDLAQNTLALLAAQLNGATSGNLTINASAITATYAITMPPAQASGVQVLSNNGAGVLSWVNTDFLPLSGGTMSGNINMGGFKIQNMASGTAPGEALQYGQIGAANGIAGLDGGGKVPLSQLPSALMTFLGAWDASTNTPTLADGTGDNGDTYRVSVAGTQNLGSGPETYFVGDFVIYNGLIWQRSPAADGVTSVNGQTGAVTVNAINQLTGDVTTTAATGSQSKAATVAAIQGTTVSGTTGSTNVVFSNAPTLTGLLSGASASFTSSVAALSLVLNGSTSGTLSHSAAAVTTSYSLIWPAAQSTGTQFLQNNGAGVLSWVTQTPTSSSGIAGSVQFAGAGGTFNSDATQLFWDNTLKRFNIGTAAGIDPLTVNIPTGGRAAQFDSSTSGDNYITSRAGTARTVLGVNRNTFGFIGSETTHPLHIRTDNTARVTISAAGAIQFNTGYGAGVAQFDSSGNITSTAPGATGNVLTSTGAAWTSQAPASTSALSAITAATVGNTIDSANFAQVWNWSTITSANAMTFGVSTSNQSGKTVQIESTGANNSAQTLKILNAGIGNGQGLNIGMTGATGAGSSISANNSSVSSNVTNLDLGLNAAAATGTNARFNHGGTSGINLELNSSGATGSRDVLRVKNGSTATANNGGSIVFNNLRTTSGATDIAAIEGRITDIGNTTYKGVLIFKTSSTNAAPSEKMRLSDAGYLGLAGNTTPFSGIDFGLNGGVAAATANTGCIALNKTSSGTNYTVHVGIGNNNTSGPLYGTGLANTTIAFQNLGGGDDSGQIELWTNNSGVDTAVRMFVRKDGTIEMKKYTAGVSQFDSTGVISSTAPGASGNLLTSNGTAWVSQAAAAAGANTALSNLAAVAINTGLIFGAGIAGSLVTANNGAGSSQAMTISTGTSAAGGSSGALTISTLLGNQNSGTISITTGTAQNNTSGSINLTTGTCQANSPGSPSGSMNFNTGSNNVGGASGNSGSFAFTTGPVTSNGSSTGSFSVTTGNGTTNTSSGNILLTIGTPAGSGTQGVYKFLKTGVAAVVGQVWTATAVDGTGYWGNAPSSSLSGLTAAVANNTIDNLNFNQVWNWSTLASGNGMLMSANDSNFSGHVLQLDTTGANNSAQTLRINNAGTGNGQGLNINMSGGTGAGSSISANNSSVSSNVTNLDFGLNAASAAGTNARFNHGGTGGINVEMVSSGSTGTKSILRIKNSGTQTANNGAQILFNNQANGGSADVAAIEGIVTDVSSSFKGAISFKTATAGGGVTERMRLNDLGYLGQGTSSPNFLIDWGNFTPGTTPNTINDKYAIAMGFNSGTATPRTVSIGIAGPNPNFSHPAYGAGTNAQAQRINVNDTSLCFTTLNTGGDGQIDMYTFNSAGNTRSRLSIATDGTTYFDKYNTNGIALFTATSWAGNTYGQMSTLAPGTSGNLLTSNGTQWVSQAPAVPAGLTRTAVAGQTFTANTSYAVRWGLTANGETSGRIYAADITTSSFDLFYVIGMASGGAGITAGQNITVTTMGSFTLGTADTAFGANTDGAPVFLTASGTFSTTAPSGSGQAITRIGIVQVRSATPASNIIDVSPAAVGVN